MVAKWLRQNAQDEIGIKSEKVAQNWDLVRILFADLTEASVGGIIMAHDKWCVLAYQGERPYLAMRSFSIDNRNFLCYNVAKRRARKGGCYGR